MLATSPVLLSSFLNLGCAIVQRCRCLPGLSGETLFAWLLAQCSAVLGLAPAVSEVYVSSITRVQEAT